MPLSIMQREEIANVLRASLRFKLNNYNPEPNSMPFHTLLLGSDRLALYSFIHSLSTNFGTAIFEPVGISLAKPRFSRVAKQAIAGTSISEGAYSEIQRIMSGLATATEEPNKNYEVERLRRVCRQGEMIRTKLTRVDLLVEDQTNAIFLFDLKTAKPNSGNFAGMKRTLLEWTAAILATNPDANVSAAIAIPYNPYAPNPYSRWTMRGMLDLKSQLLVAKEFWDFLGGDGAYEQLLEIFEEIGIELRPEIDARFAQFK